MAQPIDWTLDWAAEIEDKGLLNQYFHYSKLNKEFPTVLENSLDVVNSYATQSICKRSGSSNLNRNFARSIQDFQMIRKIPKILKL